MSEPERIQAGRKLGYAFGGIVAVLGCGALLLPGTESLRAPGAANVGHEELACADCHREAAGTLRQQLQANVQHLLGRRAAAVAVGFAPVTNSTCVACHDRPDDPHAAHRFNEPRFEDARRAIRPQSCVSCHAEHRGVRVTGVPPTFCVHCHSDLTLNDDPLTVPHSELASRGDWDTCLGCHDYHANHAFETETVVGRAHRPETIVEYFRGGPPPYPGSIIYPPTRPDHE